MIGGVRSRDSGGVIFDSRSGKDLAPARWVQNVHLVGCTGKTTNLAGTPEAPERRERRISPIDGPFFLVLGELGVDEVHRDSLDTELWNIREAGERTGGIVVICGTCIARICSANRFVKGR